MKNIAVTEDKKPVKEWPTFTTFFPHGDRRRYWHLSQSVVMFACHRLGPQPQEFGHTDTFYECDILDQGFIFTDLVYQSDFSGGYGWHRRFKRAGLRETQFRWKNGIIPFTMRNDFAPLEKKNIKYAMRFAKYSTKEFDVCL